jgi:transcriptional regulator with XRE-family HTH domain
MPCRQPEQVDDWRKIVGKNVRLRRQAAGLTQEQLAGVAEIDLTYVGGIERGKRNPSIIVLSRIAKALETEPANLLLR